MSVGRVLHGRAELGELGIDPDDLTAHLCVIGRTGVGKSTLAVRVLLQLLDLGVPWIAFDSKRDLRRMMALETSAPIRAVALGRDLRAGLHWNPLAAPPGVPAETHRRQVVELICRTWSAGDAVASLLDRVIARLMPRGKTDKGTTPTLRDVRATIAAEPLKQREATWRQTALRVLDQLTTGPLGVIFSARRDAVAVDVLIEEHTIVELDGLTSADSAFAISSLLQQITPRLQQRVQERTHADPEEHRRGDPHRARNADNHSARALRLCVFIDEAHRLLARHESSRETPLELVLREGRSLGLGIILATQTYGGISPVALGSLATWVCLQCRYRSDIQVAAQGLMLRDDQRDILTSLPVGEAEVRLGSRWPHAVHVRLTPFALPKGPVSDLDLARSFLTGPYRRAALNVRAAVEAAWKSDSAVPTGSVTPSPPAPETPPSQVVPRPDSAGVDGPHSPGTAESRPADGDEDEAGRREALEQRLAMRAKQNDGDEPGPPQDEVAGQHSHKHRREDEHAPLEHASVYEHAHSGALGHASTSEFSSATVPLPDSNADAAVLLRSVARHPLAGVTQHYIASNLSRRRGDAAKRALVQEGYLRALDLPVPEGRVVLLAPTDVSRSWLTRHRITFTPSSASLPHRYWQDRLARELTARGWTVEIEHRRDGHAFDLFARKGTSTLLAEIETGKSNIAANLLALGSSVVDRRLVFWLDPITIDRARTLAPAGVIVLQPRDVNAWLLNLAATR